jgi:predicted Zn-dependent protease
MTPPDSPSPLGYRVADRVKADGPWEVFAERARRYEVHFNGTVTEAVRGPLLVEGYGLRVFRARGDRTGIGFQASTDASEEGIRTSAADAETISAFSDFPAKKIALPSAPAPTEALDIVDAHLWEAPLPWLEQYTAALLAPFDSVKDVVPSFGSLRATLTETSIANSAGARAHYRDTTVAVEIAVKAFGGPEGVGPGEYWVTDMVRRLDPPHAGDPVPSWCQYARDARRAKAPPTGDLPVVFPAAVSATILPAVLGFRWTGAARLREMAPAAGSQVGSAEVSIYDDAHFPWGPNSSPVDDEGTPTGRRNLVQKGVTAELLYDVLHGGAFDVPPTGNALRGFSFGARDWMRFTHTPGLTSSTLVIEPGSGGNDQEIVEATGDGIWVQQLGYAFPDPISSAFGGEIRIGYRIRGGKLAEPVRGGTVGGVVVAGPGDPSMLANISAVGSRATLADSLSSPTLLIRPLTVAGEAGA